MKQLLDAKETVMAIEKMAKEIIEHVESLDNLVLVGIRNRGVPLARRIADLCGKKSGREIPVGILDITLYRDDLSRIAEQPVVKKTEIPVSIESKIIFLIDDVLYTGRTIRCALDALFDFGRPDRIHLAILVDRGGRELPIQGDIVGIHCDSERSDNVRVKLVETDGEDQVEVEPCS